MHLVHHLLSHGVHRLTWEAANPLGSMVLVNLMLISELLLLVITWQWNLKQALRVSIFGLDLRADRIKKASNHVLVYTMLDRLATL